MVAIELAELMATLLLTISPERIVLGGGIGVGQPQLIPLIRAATLDRLAGYLGSGSLENLGEIIVPAALAGDAGALGAIALGLSALDDLPPS
jgi:fructokinase